MGWSGRRPLHCHGWELAVWSPAQPSSVCPAILHQPHSIKGGMTPALDPGLCGFSPKPREGRSGWITGPWQEGSLSRAVTQQRPSVGARGLSPSHRRLRCTDSFGAFILHPTLHILLNLPSSHPLPAAPCSQPRPTPFAHMAGGQDEVPTPCRVSIQASFGVQTWPPGERDPAVE